jgi:peptidoglycan/LPS O-acetylase OafA/YrhL
MTFASGVSEIAFFKNSSVFVDFFFVLSGFVLAHAYINEISITFRKYIVTRVFRIMPLHLFMLSIFLVLEVVLFVIYQYGVVLRGEPFTGDNSLSDIIPNILLVHSWTDFTNRLSFNGPSWSISVELFLYIAFFVTLLISKAVRPLVWFAIAIGSGYLYVNEENLINDYLFRGLFSFFLGVSSYLVYQKIYGLNLKYIIASVIELALIIGVVVVVTLNSNYRLFLPGVYFSLVVLFFAFESGILSQGLKTKPFIFIGVLSYSIYMTHYFILSMFKATALVASKFLSEPLVSQGAVVKIIDLGSPIYNTIAAVILVGAVIVISSLTYRYVERAGINAGKALRI